jgi:hypothetical protein
VNVSPDGGPPENYGFIALLFFSNAALQQRSIPPANVVSTHPCISFTALILYRLTHTLSHPTDMVVKTCSTCLSSCIKLPKVPVLLDFESIWFAQDERSKLASPLRVGLAGKFWKAVRHRGRGSSRVCLFARIPQISHVL